MSEVCGVGAKRHFNAEDEEDLRREESTTSIVRRDAKVSVELRGTDRSWPEVKEHQKGFGDNVASLGLGLRHTLFEGLELAGLVHAGVAGPIGGAAGGLYVSLRDIVEADVKGQEQARALERDAAHVALIGTLDLPEGYKASRLETDYRHVPRANGGPAFKMVEALAADPKGRAKLQLHADRGMNAARDLARSGMTAEAFMKANPRIAGSCRDDAAFKEGFDAYLFARAKLPAAAVREMDRKLEERDGWYACAHIERRA